jgi:DNA-binding transcriptional LysR family regulator
MESRWGRRFFAPIQTGPGAHPASCTRGTGSFPGVESGRGVTMTPHSLLVSWSRKGRDIPLLPLWAARPVQTLSACTRVHFNFYSGSQTTDRHWHIYRFLESHYRRTRV